MTAPPHNPPHDARDCPECDYWCAISTSLDNGSQSVVPSEAWERDMSTDDPKWTWEMLRHEARRYLGVERMPRGSRPLLRGFLGRPAYPQALYRALDRYRKPWRGL